MKTNSSSISSAIEASASTFENDIAQADTLRASALAGLQGLRAAKANHTEREQARLATSLGDDHPDVLRLKAEVAQGRRFSRELGAENERATKGTPVVDKAGWVFHGFIRDQELEGQPNLTLSFFTRAGERIAALGHTCTDERGYFLLRYSSGRDPVAGQERGAVLSAASRGADLFVHVSNRNQEVLFRDVNPMKAVPGEVKYREIILGEESAACQPPSGAVSEEEPNETNASAEAPKPRKARTTKKAPKPESEGG